MPECQGDRGPGKGSPAPSQHHSNPHSLQLLGVPVGQTPQKTQHQESQGLLGVRVCKGRKASAEDRLQCRMSPRTCQRDPQVVWRFRELQSQLQICSLLFSKKKKRERERIPAFWPMHKHFRNDLLHLDSAKCLITSVRPGHNI